MWWAHTTHPKIPILAIARNIPAAPNGRDLPLLITTAWLTRPNPGRIRM